MLAQDQFTGALYEVPDGYGYGWGMGEAVDPYGQAPYDGLGFAIPGLANLIPAVGGLVGRIFGGGRAPGAPALPGLPGIPGIPGIGNLLQRLGGRLPFPGMPAPPIPPGWIRPASPYTGLGPRRMYMRCAVWPGPAGLVPAHAATMAPALPPGPGVPLAPIPGAPGAPMMRRRRRMRRR